MQRFHRTFRRRAVVGLVVGAALGLPTLARAQLTDLQHGRNYPTAQAAFGSGFSENIDFADVDADGDLDVGIGKGGDSNMPLLNALYLNQGGAQGGVEGAFLDATPARFQGVTADTSRDLDFADWDDDGDLDVYIANSGTTVNGGEVSRAYRNLGGVQQGAIGFFTEDTDAFWGTLVNIPLAQEDGVADGEGPFRDFSCDCDFADLDDDGDLDLFNSSYGPNISGISDSHVFLNDGTGRFDEIWPWADPLADTKLHTIDIDLADFDGDFDLDIFASSRNSQSRYYRNNFAQDGWAGDPFTDLTQTALFDTGAGETGISAYEAEYADVDGDGDFDVWLVNHSNFEDKVLRNIGGSFQSTSWIKGDADTDEEEADFLDYDGDGDLDVIMANFAGTNSLYQSSLADGVPLAQGVFHRTGVGSGLSPFPETPVAGNGGTTRDAEAGDLDGDGDPDIAMVNNSNQGNRYWENVLGIPDTHAPVFMRMTVQEDKADGSDTVVHATLHDNHAFYIIAFHDVDLIYVVDDGPKVCVQMSSQGGQQFRGVIPGELSGTIAYRIEASDGGGNTGVSETIAYMQTSSGSPLWQNLGCGTVGVAGDAYLELSGAQVGGQPVTLQLRDSAPNAAFLLWISFSSTPFAALGGDVHAFPFSSQVLAFTDAGGMYTASTTWPAGVLPGTVAWWQAVIQDASSNHGLVLSNAVKSTSP